MKKLIRIVKALIKYSYLTKKTYQRTQPNIISLPKEKASKHGRCLTEWTLMQCLQTGQHCIIFPTASLLSNILTIFHSWKSRFKLWRKRSQISFKNISTAFRVLSSFFSASATLTNPQIQNLSYNFFVSMQFLIGKISDRTGLLVAVRL